MGTGSRLNFVDYLARKEHLSRAALATVFLDTLLVNGHTTAMDVLWAGLPLVTVPDMRFASRVASSILLAADCPHTLARSHDDYVSVAVRLSLSPAAARHTRRCLSRARASATSEAKHGAEAGSGFRAGGPSGERKAEGEGPALFDTAGWVVGLERLLGKLWDMHALGHTFHLVSRAGSRGV